MKISVITCTFNSARYLEKNISSVKNQSFKNFEHVFIDGMSTDGTLDIIKKYQTEFPERVKFFQFAPGGISRAMNQGIEKASGEYLIHLHSDDSFFDGEVLNDVAKFLEANNNPDWIYGQINVLSGEESRGFFPVRKIWQKSERKNCKSYLLKFYNYIPHQAVFIKKSVFDKFGNFDETIKCGMDPDLWLRIRAKTRWLFFRRVISNFSIRPDAQSSGLKNKSANERNYLTVRKRHLNKLELIVANLVNGLIKLKNSNYQK